LHSIQPVARIINSKGSEALSIRKCAESDIAFRRLSEIYRDREKELLSFRKKGGKIVGELGCDVPDELIIAAGMMPVRIYADEKSTLVEADKYLELSFDPVVKAQFEKLVDGSYNDLIDFLAISNSTDVIIRTYLYLREIKRIEPDKLVHPVEFIDWLFTRKSIHQIHNEKTVQLFWQKLEEWSGRKITDEDFIAAAEICNKDRAALRKISALRRAQKPRITGSEALVIIGSAFFMSRSEHAQLVEQVANKAQSWPEVEGVRLFLTGSAQESTELYSLIEKSGGVVIGEDHDWGDRFSSRDCNLSYSPLRSIVDCYMLRDFSSKKAFVSQRVKSLDEAAAITGAQGVIFYINAYEEAASWDYPSQKKSLEERGILTKAFVKMSYPVSQNVGLEDKIRAFTEALKGR
jgi:benzoyl-CoA reductase/2-hydroxyglutaryl-CoA dehydratase subunit BcrC/BadD/HgdB